MANHFETFEDPRTAVLEKVGLNTGIEARDWGWRHAGRKKWAIRNLDLRINSGERVVIVGPSGAGKSTLLHAIAGVSDEESGQSEGTLTIDDRSPASPYLRGSVGLVQQDPESQRVMDRIGDEVAFGCENLGLPREEIWKRARISLDAVGLDLALDHSTAMLSGGEKQRLALACSFAMNPKVLLLDEPTANLDPEGAEDLRRVTKDLVAASGATLIVVDHNVGPWLDQVDRLIVLGPRGLIADGPAAQIIKDERDLLLAAGVWLPGFDPRSLLGGAAPLHAGSGPIHAGTARRHKPGDMAPALEASDLVIGYTDGQPLGHFDGTSFAGEGVTCIVGPNGAGKTTFALTLAGLLPPISGKVTVSPTIQGDQVSPSPIDWDPTVLSSRISMVFQEPQYQFLKGTVEDELGLGLNLAGFPKENVQPLVEQYLERLGLESLRRAHPLSLSGGEKRRLAVGTALITSPRILVLDEPTFGQDLNNWVGIVDLLLRARNEGVTLVVVTHDKNLVAAIADEILVIEDDSARESRLASVEGAGAVTRKQRGAKAGKNTDGAAARQPVAPLSRVNPAVQILSLILMTVPLLLSIDPVSAGVALILELAILPAAGISAKKLLLRTSPLLVAAPLAAISMLLYGAVGGDIHWMWGPVVVSDNSIQLALSLALRVLAVGLPAVVILSGLDATDVADSLTQVVRLPSRFVLSSLAGIRMVGLMIDDWYAMKRARRSRGVRGNQFLQSAFSLLTFALRRSESLAVSMEARGFGSNLPRSNARVSKLSAVDAVMVVISCLIPLLALGAAVAFGSFTWFGLR